MPQIMPIIYGSHGVVLVGSTLYWTTGGAGKVFSVPTTGGAATPISLTENLPDKIVSDGTNIYYTDWTRIRYLSVAGGSPSTLPIPAATNQFATPTGIAVDSTYVYWSNQGGPRGSATIWRANKTDGSNPTQLVMTPADSIQSITIDATTIYFTSNYGGGNMGVYSIPIGGGSATTLAGTEMFPGMITSDANAIYWLDGSRVRKMTKSGGPASVTTIVPVTALLSNGTLNDIALDANYLYFTQGSVGFTLYRFPKN
jgi:hypothetical protein